MRSASRVFYAIALFAVVVGALYTVGGGYDDPQGSAIFGFFAAACGFLGFLLGRQSRFDLVGFATAGEEAEGEEIHLPGPSWYPALYAVACAVIVAGAIASYAVLAVGVAFLVLTTVGWARESVVEYRREVAHAKPPAADPPSDQTVRIAHRVSAFRQLHGGTDAVVQHVGRGRGEVVLVGADGAWGNFAVPDVAAGREGCALAGATVHAAWPAGLSARIDPDEDLWRRMGGVSAFTPPEHEAPRDGATQVAARVFLWIGVFAVLAAGLYYLPQRSWDAVQGTSILAFFGAANFYLYVALRNAKAPAADAAFAGDDFVTIEPDQPPSLDPATLHLPGPSWWPAAFAVAGVTTVVGMAVSLTAVAVGAALLVVCSVGWAVESVREYRAQLAHAGHGHGDHP